MGPSADRHRAVQLDVLAAHDSAAQGVRKERSCAGRAFTPVASSGGGVTARRRAGRPGPAKGPPGS